MPRPLNCLLLATALLGTTFVPLHAAPGVGGLLAEGLTKQAELRRLRLAEKEAEQKVLDQEAKQITAEAERLTALRRTIEMRHANLLPRMEAHNRTPPDRTNLEAVRQYNLKAEGLNAEKAAAEADIRAHELARQRLRDRASDFERRTREFFERWK